MSKKKSQSQPKFVTDDKTTARLQRQHAQVQADIEALPEDRRKEVRSLQSQVDAEVAKMNFDLDQQFDIEKKWREATGLNHTQAEDVLRTMSNRPIGEIKDMYGKQWVHTPFKTVVQAQAYVDVLQGRILELIGNVDQETSIHQLIDYRSKLVLALKQSNELVRQAEEQVSKVRKEFTNMSALGLMKLSIKRFFRRGN